MSAGLQEGVLALCKTSSAQDSRVLTQPSDLTAALSNCHRKESVILTLFLNSISIISCTKIPLQEESQGGLSCRIACGIIIKTLCCPCLKAITLLCADLTARGAVCE